MATVAAEFAGWGPKVHERLRSGSPANEIVKAAKELGAGLVVVASGSRGLSDTVLLGSTAQRVAALRALPGARRTPGAAQADRVADPERPPDASRRG